MRLFRTTGLVQETIAPFRNSISVCGLTFLICFNPSDSLDRSGPPAWLERCYQHLRAESAGVFSHTDLPSHLPFLRWLARGGGVGVRFKIVVSGALEVN